MKKSPPPLLSRQQAKALDSLARERYAISTLVLMENAGRAVAEEAIRILQNNPRKIGIFCGRGQNGGDGFVTARHLLTYGIKPDVFLCGEINAVRNEARINLDILIKLGQKIIVVNQNNLKAVKKRIFRYSLVIDALLGVGLLGEVRGLYQDLIRIINTTQAYILSVDIPSGLDTDTGRILGCCVKADKTVTFAFRKRGMVIGAGPKYCGTVVVRDLGIPYPLGILGGLVRQEH